jgi:hypothetical protein
MVRIPRSPDTWHLSFLCDLCDLCGESSSFFNPQSEIANLQLTNPQLNMVHPSPDL